MTHCDCAPDRDQDTTIQTLGLIAADCKDTSNAMEMQLNYEMEY